MPKEKVYCGGAWKTEYGYNASLDAEKLPPVDQQGKLRFFINENRFKKEGDRKPDLTFMYYGPRRHA